MAAQELLLSEVTAEGPTSCCAMQSSTTNIFILLRPFFSSCTSNLEDLAFEIILAQLSS